MCTCSLYMLQEQSSSQALLNNLTCLHLRSCLVL